MTLFDLIIVAYLICLLGILLALIFIYILIDDTRTEALATLYEIRNELRKLNKKRGKK